jgi:hypothetical protein
MVPPCRSTGIITLINLDRTNPYLYGILSTDFSKEIDLESLHYLSLLDSPQTFFMRLTSYEKFCSFR